MSQGKGESEIRKTFFNHPNIMGGRGQKREEAKTERLPKGGSNSVHTKPYSCVLGNSKKKSRAQGGEKERVGK